MDNSATQRGEKRPLEESGVSINLALPIKRKIFDTENYHYKKLFLEGNNSDITLNILDKQYFLHKVFLCQSPYFSNMFGGTWLESNQNLVTIQLVDNTITQEALDKVFGSLYKSTITITAAEAVSVLAAAQMFQLNGLIEECVNIMIDTINQETVISFYEAACRFSCKKLEGECFNWLLLNCLHVIFCRPDMSLDLLEKLLSHPDLFCGFGEHDIYTFLKVYICFKENGRVSDPALTDEYFLSKTGVNPYLRTEEGLKYVPVFQKVRLQFMITNPMYLEQILKDNIVPEDWLTSFVMNHWKTMILKERYIDTSFINVTRESFLSNCQRRSFYVEGNQTWDWRNTPFSKLCITVMKTVTGKIKLILAVEFSLMNMPTLKCLGIRVILAKLHSASRQLWWRSNIIQIGGVQVKVCEFENMTFPLHVTVNAMPLISFDESCIVEEVEVC